MEPLNFKRFRIKEIEGPFDRGVLNQFHDYILVIELDRGESYKYEQKRVAIRFTDWTFYHLAEGNPTDPEYSNDARARVVHYAKKALKPAIAASGVDFEEVFSPTQEEADDLARVEPTRVDMLGWQDLARSLERTNRVFISCGQQSQEEIDLGQEIVDAVNRVPGLEAYFAENQQSLEGVTHNIFQAIYTSSGLIAVIHRRDQISSSPVTYRGSVWVEQEIAIGSFLVQALGRPLPVRVYMEKEIKREGVRRDILLNPIEFESSEEVLADLGVWLQTLTDLSISADGN